MDTGEQKQRQPEQPPEMPESSDESTTLLSRREMVQILVGAGVSVGVALALAGPLSPAIEQLASGLQPGVSETDGQHKPRWGMVIDLNTCIGCEYCVYACQATNDVTNEMRWNIHVVDQTPKGDTFHVTRPCLHCQNAPCVSVCPVTATYQRDDGLVVMDYDICIGCRYCQAACPYGARSFNWFARDESPNPYAPEWGTPEVERRPRGVIEKCTFCIQRIDLAKQTGQTPGVDPEVTPACVNICPVTARYFGDLNDPNSPVSRVIATMPTFRLREDLGTEPNVYYIPPEGLAI
jgi:Fe-S-cluster-containing dehydrogenase component